jgi:hypothetical protein
MLIEKLVLQTADIEGLKSFYGTTLGMELRAISKSGFAIRAGSSQLEFVQAKKGTQPSYHFAFNIPCNQLQEAVTWLNDKVQLLWIADYDGTIADFSSWQAQAVYFFDPAGNIVEFIARSGLNNTADSPFLPSKITNISEAGLVFPAGMYDAAVESLLADYDLAYFCRQAPLPQFRAIGDDEGLLICVPENRVWYPTKNIFSAVHPLKLVFREKETTCVLNV